MFVTETSLLFVWSNN